MLTDFDCFSGCVKLNRPHQLFCESPSFQLDCVPVLLSLTSCFLLAVLNMTRLHTCERKFNIRPHVRNTQNWNTLPNSLHLANSHVVYVISIISEIKRFVIVAAKQSGGKIIENLKCTHSLQCYLFAITPSQGSAERKKKTLFPVMGWV